MDKLIGTVLGGCEIVQEIGQGGMGVVYKARQISLDREVAIKVLAHHLAVDQNFVRRFQHEARAVAKVNHPNILTVFDVGEENGIYYMVMEFINGRSMSEILTDKELLPPKEASDVVRQAALGLERAQSAGIIHRDIKPDNIMFTEQHIVKVSDFGLAKEVENSMTMTDAVMGTPAYMSPEQCDGKKLAGRTDIYSLGGTFYRMVTGRLPFEAETAMSMMYRHKHEPLVPPHEIVPAIPVSVSRVVVKMMAKQREERYQTMGEVIKAIDAAWEEAETGKATAHETSKALEATIRLDASGEPISAPAVKSPALKPATVQGPTVSQTGVTQDPERARELATEAEAALVRGDVLSAVRLLQQALRLDTQNETLRQRLTGLVTPEVRKLVEAGKKMLVNGQYSEAARAFRNAVDLDPADEEARSFLDKAEGRLLDKRNSINEIRQLIKEMKFDEVVKRWEESPPEVREKNLEKQVERIRDVTIPARQLAAQADDSSAKGRLEEAVGLYQKVMELDPNNQRAKEGLKEVQRKKSRADVMLKEGYERFVARDFDKAIEIWQNILNVLPGDDQVRKRLGEAYNEAINDAKGKEGGAAKIIKYYKGLIELQPGNRDARALLEKEEVRLRDINEFSDKASRAFSKRKYGQAAKYWEKLLEMDPQNRKITASLKVARQKRSNRRIRNLTGFIVFLLILAAGGVYYSETDMFQRAEAAANRGDVLGALDILRRPRFDIPVIIFKEKYQAKILELRKTQMRTEADRLYKGGKTEEAVTMLEDLLKLAGDEDRAEKKRVEKMMHKWKAEDLRKSAEAAENAGRLAEAAKLFTSLSAEAGAAGETELVTSATAKSRVLTILATLEESTKMDIGERVNLLKEAVGVMPDYPRLQALIKQGGYDFKVAADKLREGERLVDERSFREALTILEDVSRLDPSLTDARIMAAFAKDNLYCAGLNMALIPPKGMSKFSSNPHWRGSDRTKSFCIDLYEYPNAKGSEVKTSITFLDAVSSCRQLGKRLCKADEWEYACAGPKRLRYPYGGTLIEGRCNFGIGAGKEAAGSRPGCVSPFGIFDMTGNVTEWTENRAATGNEARQFISGGNWGLGADESTCTSRVAFSPILMNNTLGFRCCADLPPQEGAEPESEP